MKEDKISNWVEEQKIRGRYIFTKKDVVDLSLPKSKDSLNVALYRLISKGTIVSPWHNFYVAVPTEYQLKGEVPPSFYIDQLMNFLGRDYYVSLLSAAAINGAGHQRAMIFQVTITGNDLRSGLKNGTRLEFTNRKDFPEPFVNKVKTQTGYMNVSSPELTALDLIAHEEKIGGLSRAAEVLVELADDMRWDDKKIELLGYFKTPVIQRLGYLLHVIEESELEGDLLTLAKQSGRIFRKVPLKQAKPVEDGMEVDKNWKIIINQEIEIDNI